MHYLASVTGLLQPTGYGIRTDLAGLVDMQVGVVDPFRVGIGEAVFVVAGVAVMELRLIVRLQLEFGIPLPVITRIQFFATVQVEQALLPVAVVDQMPARLLLVLESEIWLRPHVLVPVKIPQNLLDPRVLQERGQYVARTGGSAQHRCDGVAACSRIDHWILFPLCRHTCHWLSSCGIPCSNRRVELS